MSASPTTNRYSIEIKNVAGKPLVFINVDWTDDEARVAVAQILRLASTLRPAPRGSGPPRLPPLPGPGHSLSAPRDSTGLPR